MQSVGKKEILWPSVLVIGLLHLGALIALITLFSRGFSGESWRLAVILYLASGLGITVGYHRMETHRGLETNAVMKWLLFAAGALSLQGNVYDWTANHRVHHFKADIPGEDPHSPREYPGFKGLMWAHVGWILCRYERPEQYRRFRDLDADRVVGWHRRNYLWLVVASFVLPTAIAGWDGFWLAGLLRITFVLNMTWSVNSICHAIGLKAKDSRGKRYNGDDSRNFLPVGILGFGEGYHSNHHARPEWAYHGWKWYDIDLGKWLILALEKLRLVRNVKKPDRDLVFSDKVAA